jgi:hypothetical protein
VEDSAPAHGSLTLSADGSFTYTPNPGFTGADTFTYKANDKTADSAPATVAIQVGAVVSQPPVATDDAYNAPQYWGHLHNHDHHHHHPAATLPVPAPGLLATDTDPNAKPLTAILVQPPSNGTATLRANGYYRYTPRRGFVGTDTFTYKANNGSEDSAPATVTLTVSPWARSMVRTRRSREHDKNHNHTGKWRAVAVVIISDLGHHGILKATVQGHWSGAATTTVTGTTNGHGRVRLRSDLISAPGTATFTVDSVDLMGQAAVVRGLTSKSVSGP